MKRKLRIRRISRDQLFWAVIVPLFVYVTIALSMAPWVAHLLASPPDQIFSGINRWSIDYFYYLSYTQQGVRGQILERYLNTHIPHPSVLVHLAYTVPGFILGKIGGLDSIFIYHFTRAFLGVVFMLTLIFFFYRICKSKIVTSLSFLFIFYVGGFSRLVGEFPWTIYRPLSQIQEQHIVGRATGPPHYTLGYIFFVLSVWVFFYAKLKPIKKMLLMGLTLNIMTMANPFTLFVIGSSFVVYGGLVLLFSLWRRTKDVILRDFPILFFSFLLAVPTALYYKSVLSGRIWGTFSNAMDYFIPLPPIATSELIRAIGPVLPLGIFGALIYSIFWKRFRISPRIATYFIALPVAQFSLFFKGSGLKLDPVRLFNGLYYIPLSFFSALLIFSIARFLASRTRIPTLAASVSLFLIPLIITAPTYYQSMRDQWFAYTDYKSFPPITYPRKTQVEALKFLEQNTPFPSTVLAMYEASVLMHGLSGNIAIPDGIPERYQFYKYTMSHDQARKFLDEWGYDYVYFGAQEKFASGDISQYPFLKKIFENEEVTIFEVTHN